LLDDKSEVKTKDESIDACEKIIDDKDDEKNNEDNKNKSNEDISVLSHSESTNQEEKKPAWIDEDDCNYT